MTGITGYIITIRGDQTSEWAYKHAMTTIPKNLNAHRFDAVTPDQVDDMMVGLQWTYPWEGQRIDIKSGLTLSAYKTTNPKSRIACFLSHYTLWKKCIEDNEPIIIMEHDVAFYRLVGEIPVGNLNKSYYNIIGLNSPRGATRRADIYHKELSQGSLSEHDNIVRVPMIDTATVPQGLAGNSCYYIRPDGAKKMVELVKEYGCWPNDALMCRQLVKTLGATKKYHSYVQGTTSTTT